MYEQSYKYSKLGAFVMSRYVAIGMGCVLVVVMYSCILVSTCSN